MLITTEKVRVLSMSGRAFAVCLALSASILGIYLMWTSSFTGWRESVNDLDYDVEPIETALDLIPLFVFYVRFAYNDRWATEYKNVLVRSMKLFVPTRMANLVVVLDEESPQSKNFANEIAMEWPYPEVCFRPPGDPSVYYGWGKARMFWDMMHPDLCTNATYVGYVDTDTLFDTIVTPQLLFEDNKPIIVAKIGLAPYPCWVKSTERFLMKKEVMQCMSTFPVTVKTEHMKIMRDQLSKQFGKDFEEVFRDSALDGQPDCICQFSFMCNYLWYYHRNEYVWHLQTVPDGDWNGAELRDGQVDPWYYETEVKPEMKIPIPRTSVHLRYTIIDGVTYNAREPSENEISEIVKEGLCYSAGFQYCPKQCKKWSESVVQYHLYSFEFYQWFWDSRCKEEQDKHYKNVKELVDYHVQNNMAIFGLRSIHDLCKVIADWQY